MMIEEIYPSTPRLEATVGPEEPGISRPDLFDGFKEALESGGVYEVKVAMQKVITAAAVDMSIEFNPGDIVDRLEMLTRAKSLTASGRREEFVISSVLSGINSLRSRS